MPTYIFDITEDGQTEPSVTLELAGESAARAEAMRAIAEMMSGEMPNGDKKELEVLVKRDSGTDVLTVRLTLDTEWHSGSARSSHR